MKSVFFALCAAFASPALADVADSIYDRAATIQREVYRSEAPRADLQRADELLAEALRLVLRTGGGGVDPACVNFAYQKYYVDQSSSAAQTAATAACRKIVDLSVAQFLWAKYYVDLSSSAAMNAAADGAAAGVAGKLDVVEFAWTKYYVDLSSANAATRAATGARAVGRGALACVQTAWTNFYRDLSASAAMDRALESCR